MQTVSHTHALRYRLRASDPDGRDEVETYCGRWDECSGSGRHSLVSDPTCPACRAGIAAEAERSRRTCEDCGAARERCVCDAPMPADVRRDLALRGWL